MISPASIAKAPQLIGDCSQAGKALRAIRETDLRAIREDLTGKERLKLQLLQRCRGLYDVLLRVVKF